MSKKTTLVTLSLIMAALLMSACGAGVDGQQVADAVEQIASAQESTAGTGATATVTAKSLRVRAAPSADAEVIAGIKEGEQYQVAGLSSDGEWVQLAIPKAQGGKGWVSANFVSVQGAITDAPITDAPVATTGSTKPGNSGAITATQTVVAVAPPAAGTATVTTEGARLRVRAQPDTTSDIVGFVYNGENYPVVEQSSDGLWVRIGGREGTDNLAGGWVAAEFLVLGQ
jgi:uncharacterized protein YgiM (DUF1202 family)